MSTAAASSPSSVSSVRAWPSLQRVACALQDAHQAHPHLARGVRAAVAAGGTLAMGPWWLELEPSIAPVWLLWVWTLLVARMAGRMAAVSAGGAGAWWLAAQAEGSWSAPSSSWLATSSLGQAALAASALWFVCSAQPVRRRPSRGEQPDAQVAAREDQWRAALQEVSQIRDMFLGVAGHELRSPVTGALLHAQRWQRRALLPGTTSAEHGAAWQRQACQLGRLARLMESLLDASHVSHGAIRLYPETVDVGLVLGEVVERLSEAACRANCPIGLRLPEGAFYGRLDPLRFEQTVEHLLSNALKYGAGKPVEVELRRIDTGLELRVTDRGMGIDAVHHERIFAAYERVAPSIAEDSQPAGLGLGLWLVNQVALAAGGQVAVRSALAQGATFWVRLPC